MKVQIIYLDPHDDHVSARDKLGWAKAPRVLLVWPGYGQILNRKLDLVLLQRYAEQHNFQLGLVTRDPAVIEVAQSMTIPTFHSLDDVSESGWRRPARGRPARLQLEDRKPSRTELRPQPKAVSPRAKQWDTFSRPILLGLALLSVLFLAFALIPSAEIHLSPITQQLTIQATFTLDPDTEIAQPDGRIPGYPITSRTIGSFRIPTSGSTTIPGTQARGLVIFTNLTSDRIVVPVGTGLRSTSNPNLRFITSEEIELPDEEGAEIQSLIMADTPGPQGNVPAAAIDAVEGTLGLQLEVTNPEPLIGGNDMLRAAVAAADRDRVEQELTHNLLEEAEEEMVSRLEPGEVFIATSMHITDVYRRTFDREVGEPADSLSVELELEVSAFYYLERDLEAAVRMVLARSKPEGLQVVTDIYDFEVTEIITPAIDQISLTTQAWQYGYESINDAALRRLLRAKPPQEALRLLQDELTLGAAPSIQLRPAWLPRLPWLPLKISISYEWPGLR